MIKKNNNSREMQRDSTCPEDQKCLNLYIFVKNIAKGVVYFIFMIFF